MKIKALAMDVDGTLTDGGIYIGNSGEIMKRFCVKDGYAISHMLPKMGAVPIIITGRKSGIVQERCAELGITRVIQGSSDKLADLREMLASENIRSEEVAYIGDDMNDYECMLWAGVKGCPNDAAEGIKEISDYVTERDGGKGAVREFVEWLTKIQEKEKGE